MFLFGFVLKLRYYLLFIRFLPQTAAAELEEMGELALAMATVIVERSSLLPALLPGPPHPAATGAAAQVLICFPRDLFKPLKIFVQAATYAALLAAFCHYMQLVRQQDARYFLLPLSNSTTSTSSVSSTTSPPPPPPPPPTPLPP